MKNGVTFFFSSVGFVNNSLVEKLCLFYSTLRRVSANFRTRRCTKVVTRVLGARFEDNERY